MGKSRLNDDHYGYDVGYFREGFLKIADSIKATAGFETESSLILNHVENGVAVRMAVLYLLAGGE